MSAINNTLKVVASVRQLSRCSLIRYRPVLSINRKIHRSSNSLYSVEPLAVPQSSQETKQYAPKLHSIVSEVSKLTLLEVAELNELLKKSLNIPDAPMMPMGGFAAAPAAQADEEEAPKAKSSYTVKLIKFDETRKVPLIKEIKTLVEGLNLVQAKKFVEGVPQVIRADVGKDEAEKIKQSVEAAGGICELV